MGSCRSSQQDRGGEHSQRNNRKTGRSVGNRLGDSRIASSESESASHCDSDDELKIQMVQDAEAQGTEGGRGKKSVDGDGVTVKNMGIQCLNTLISQLELQKQQEARSGQERQEFDAAIRILCKHGLNYLPKAVDGDAEVVDSRSRPCIASLTTPSCSSSSASTSAETSPSTPKAAETPSATKSQMHVQSDTNEIRKSKKKTVTERELLAEAFRTGEVTNLVSAGSTVALFIVGGLLQLLNSGNTPTELGTDDWVITTETRRQSPSTRLLSSMALAFWFLLKVLWWLLSHTGWVLKALVCSDTLQIQVFRIAAITGLEWSKIGGEGRFAAGARACCSLAASLLCLADRLTQALVVNSVSWLS